LRLRRNPMLNGAKRFLSGLRPNGPGPQTSDLRPQTFALFPRQTPRSPVRTREAGRSNTRCRTVERGWPDGRTRVAARSNAARPHGWAAPGGFPAAESRGNARNPWKRLGRSFPEIFPRSRRGRPGGPRERSGHCGAGVPPAPGMKRAQAGGPHHNGPRLIFASLSCGSVL
jgi:hypothetical protein